MTCRLNAKFMGNLQAWRVEMNLFTKNIRGFVDFGKQAEPKNPCVSKIKCYPQLKARPHLVSNPLLHCFCFLPPPITRSQSQDKTTDDTLSQSWIIRKEAKNIYSRGVSLKIFQAWLVPSIKVSFEPRGYSVANTYLVMACSQPRP